MTSPAPRDTAHLVARLRFRHLQLLAWLQHGGSLRAAAQALNLTQPALSKSLGEIESAFGFALFTRSARGLAPTPQGAVACRGAVRLLAELAHLHGEAAAGHQVQAVVRVGAPPFVAQGYLPEVLARLTQGPAPVRVRLMEERVPLLLQALAEGEVDALVTSYPTQMPLVPDLQLRIEKLFEAEFVVIAPPRHPLARARQVDWLRLADEPWVLPAPTTMLSRLLEESFLRAGAVPPASRVESSSPLTNVRLVAAGTGLSAVPAAMARSALALNEVQRVRVQPAIGPGPVALIGLAGAPSARVQLLRQALGLAPG